MTPAETAEFLALMALLWRGVVVDEPTVAAWARFLGDVTPEEAGTALELLAATRPFPPTIAEVRQAVARLRAPEAAQILPAEAWAQVRREIARVGVYGEPTELSPLVRRAVETLGWREICLSENPEAVRRQFLEVYEAYRRRVLEAAAVSPALRARLFPDLAEARGAVTAPVPCRAQPAPWEGVV
jgi:ribosomal protein L29